MKYVKTILIPYLSLFLLGILLFQSVFRSRLASLAAAGFTFMTQNAFSFKSKVLPVLLSVVFSVILALLVFWYTKDMAQMLRTLLFFLIYYLCSVPAMKWADAQDQKRSEK
ncbi:MAG: hypothetical protein SOI44_09110 [Lactimicrobium sp.]|jgi:fatty acid desaturase|uniref:hypothetical protein n=1 Tax=Lactimicrobium sp. TaxID=2563780 RepID=UPI002F3518EF